MKDGKSHTRDGALLLKTAKTILALASTRPDRTKGQARLDFLLTFGARGTPVVPMVTPRVRRLSRALLDGSAADVGRTVHLITRPAFGPGGPHIPHKSKERFHDGHSTRPTCTQCGAHPP